MKILAILSALLFAPLLPAQEAKEPVILMPWNPAPKEAPLFFSASAAVKARVSLTEATSDQELTFVIHQGRPERLSLALSGPGEVLSVSGDGLRDWSLRTAADGARFLDLQPVLPEAKDAPMPKLLKVTARTRQAVADGAVALLLPRQAAATGLALDLSIEKDPNAEVRAVKVQGLLPVAGGGDIIHFTGTGAAAVELEVRALGSATTGLELAATALAGKVAADGNSVAFTLTTTATATEAGVRMELCSGAALASGVAGDGWHLVLRKAGDRQVYDLVAERAGDLAVQAELIVPVARKGDWHSLSLRLAGGVVVPLRLAGLPAKVEFDRTLSVVPEPVPELPEWQGFLPAGGEAALAWRGTDEVADGALFFSSTETTDIRVGSGLLRQLTVIDLRVLQGKLGAVNFALTGPGEVLAVTGEGVLGWTLTGEPGPRVLAVTLSQPITATGRLLIESQAPLGEFPLTAGSLRVTPQGSLRHSGWLRVANEGAVRVEVSAASGLIQLAPAQFPAGVDKSLRQVFVFRFPSAEHDFTIQADQVMPEVSVTETTVYELAEADRRVHADLELDIREAPLREWELEVPVDYAVAGVQGEAVADYQLVGGAESGRQRVRVLFKQALDGRQLIHLRLEQNQAAKAGPWELAPLAFPGAKSRRGFIGAVAAPGFRLVPGKSSGLVEVPLTFFPHKTDGLQQAFRLRGETWQLALSVEALGQSVQADVFHLYSLKSGAAYVSVLINYFVIGAPASEWRVALPAGIGNVDVTGENVGRDWRHEENTLIVPLSRSLLGAGTMLLTFEQPMDPRGGELALGEVRPLGVQGERGYVQVVSPMQVKFSVLEASGPLLEIDASELPAELRMLSSLSGAPTLKVWQYSARDFKISTRAEWYPPAETAEQVVDFLKLASQVSRDGGWSTEARMFVKSRVGNVLRIDLPKQASLWEVRVNGSPANARQDGGHTLVPLPAGADSKKPVEISLRYGAQAQKADRVTLAAPKLAAPVVIGEWTVKGDAGRQLVPRGGNADLVRSGRTEHGFAWLARKPWVALYLAGLALVGGFLGRKRGGWLRRTLALACGVLLVAAALALAVGGFETLRGSGSVLEFAAPAVAPDAGVVVDLDNLPPWRAHTNGYVWGFSLAGLLILGGGFVSGKRWLKTLGIAILGFGLLAIHGGAAPFFLVVAVGSAVWCLLRLRGLFKSRRPAVLAATSALVVLTLFGGERVHAAGEEDAPPAAESMIHHWQIARQRLAGTVDVVVRGEAGSRFLLLSPPAVLSGFEGEGLRVVKAPYGKDLAYFIVLDQAGRCAGKARFEMPLENPADGWLLPGGMAAMRQVSVSWDQPGWDFLSPSAARVQPLSDLPPGHSGALLTLNPDEKVILRAQARQRDAATEETRFFAEVANLYLPGPGVVNGRHLVSIKPSQGTVSALTLTVPENFTVSDVIEGPVASWRFDPEKRELRVTIAPAQSAAFGVLVETQRGAEALPVELAVAPLRVSGSAGELGSLAIGCGDDAQVEAVAEQGLTRVTAEDFTAALLPRDPEGQPLATLQQSFRYAAADAHATIKVSALAPELRAETLQLVSLGDDRLVLRADLNVTITRAGIFRLRVELPDGLEIESATGEGLSHWTEARTDGKRFLTLHLLEKTVGVRSFNIVLAAPSPGVLASWQVPRLRVPEASRESGLLAVVPEGGMQVRTVKRHSLSPEDPAELLDHAKGFSKSARLPGALTYRLLQADWALTLAIGRLDPWVSVRVFHEVTLREGQMLHRAVLSYHVENAPVKTLRVRIPGLDATAAATVRASGQSLADLVPVPGEPDLWEMRFERGIVHRNQDGGEKDTRVEILYQRGSVDQGPESLQTLVPEGSRQGAYFLAIRTPGRLEVTPGTLPRGWQRADWSVVQSTLGAIAGNIAPLASFRVAEPEGPLPITLKQLELTALQRLRVASGTLTTLLAPSGQTMTAVDLKLELSAKAPLTLSLPAGADLFNVLVNDEPANLVRQDDGWQFYVFPSPQVGQPARVRFTYAAKAPTPLRLDGPQLNVPMENLTWRVLVPEGWRITDHGGDFRLNQQLSVGAYGLDDYKAFSASKLQADSQRATSMFDQAKSHFREGRQELASQALGNVLRSNQLDEATNEDARELEFKTKTDQAMLGLATRRQRVQIDNRRNMTADFNERLDRATAANPLMQGQMEFDPRKLDQFLEGNTSDENSAIREMSRRMVAQQLAAEAAPQALDITLPERGTVLTFGRSVQVDTKRMALDLTLKRRDPSAPGWLLASALCLALGLLLAGRKPARPETSDTGMGTAGNG